MIASRFAWLAMVLASAACAGPVGVLGRDEQPAQASQLGARDAAQTHAHNDSTIELPSDEQIVEPDHPAVATPQERALTHVHTPKGVCSGVVVGPRVIVTAHQCLGGEAGGVSAVAPSAKFFVEVATSTLTWTKRQVTYAITPACVWEKVDVAALVLAEAVEWVQPLRVSTSPPPGITLQALGFGRCAGETRSLSQRTGELLRREGDALVVDVPLCRGDVGGPVVDPNTAALLGIISHQDDPEGATRRTTTIARLDTTPARGVVAQAQKLADAPDAVKLDPVACE